MGELKIITPKTLTLVTTNKCTASCTDCCFNCSPKNSDMMTYEEMCHYIDDSLLSFPSIKIVVITGGECFLLKEDLEKIITYIHHKKLLSRVVTNGYWATNLDSAYEILKKLKDSGLTEINFSTGDNHLKWVPYQVLKNGILASLKLNFCTCVNVETKKDQVFTPEVFSQDPDFSSYIESKKLNIICGMWMPFTEESLMHIETFSDTDIIRLNCERCTNIFSSVNILPTHKMVACCGLAASEIPCLDLGDIRTQAISDLYCAQFDDFLKIWLFIEGPYRILEFVASKIGKDNVQELRYSCHSCFYCAVLFTNQRYLDVVKQFYKEKYSSIMMRYIIYQKIHKYEDSK